MQAGFGRKKSFAFMPSGGDEKRWFSGSRAV
jgi:hypothetical protein